jgi:peptidyl-prolyl cis-trans isomerase C
VRTPDLSRGATWLRQNRLAHFVAIGLVLWALMPKARNERQVVVESVVVADALRAEQARLARPLTVPEKQQIMGELVAAEVLLREGLRLGVGVDDPVVRGRLADRMRAHLEASLPAPVSNEEARAEAARLAPQMPVRARVAVAFVSRERPDAAPFADALARTLAAAPETPAPYGADRAPLDAGAWWNEPELARAAGPLVARAAMSTPVGAWSGPVASAWGFYVIRPLERRAPSTDELLATGLASVRRRKRGDAVGRAALRLASDYDVTVNAPAGEPAYEPGALRPGAFAGSGERGSDGVD